jgi:hypothetical protein
MSRLVFSFSLPEESEAAWMLKKYKREGKILSHIIQNAIEYGAKEQISMNRDLEWHRKNLTRSTRILGDIFGVDVDDFSFYPTEYKDSNKLQPHQPIDTLQRARDRLNQRTEFTVAKMTKPVNLANEEWMRKQKEMME